MDTLSTDLTLYGHFDISLPHHHFDTLSTFVNEVGGFIWKRGEEGREFGVTEKEKKLAAGCEIKLNANVFTKKKN